MNKQLFLLIGALSGFGLTSVCLGGQYVNYVGKVSVGTNLGRIVADPTRAAVYGISETGQVCFINTQTRSVDKVITTNRKLTDIDVDPSGRFLRVLDNVTNEYWNQPPATYVLTYDLNTQTQSGAFVAQAPLYEMALGREDRVVGVEWNQWIRAFQIDSTTGNVLSTADGGYYGGGSWTDPITLVSSPDGNRMYRTEVGISSIELRAYDTSTDTMKLLAARDVGSYSSEPVFINSTGTSLYAGDIRVNPANIQQVQGLFPETIFAATGDDRLAFGMNHIYDPAWGTRLDSLPVNFRMMAIGDHDQYLYAFDPDLQELHIMSVVPEPMTWSLLLAGGLAVLRRGRRR